ncbi:SIMPL domain-containing protein [Actinoplanes sp. TBRC 11911]|uniref:SIMPL domain-containing protein n=1 Tax=Actinoplanes sp. TBRC 11911 TaxID=2729386 RepID=UPI00145F4757|nr:SIMPL domain-containing protein [Actinoplanes sp. TBRC 11911]NMO53807.1 SIMPL domain-containing protein [Actinoplanes sp. TBRC 11911]
MNRSRVTTPALVVLATLVLMSSGMLGGRPAYASANGATDSPPAGQPRESVSVTGWGEVFGEPDTLTAEFAAETTAVTVEEAVDRATAAATRMRDSLIRAGVARADLQTSNVTIGSNMNENRKITGYTVSQGLTATIRDLPRAGALLSATIAAGGDAARLNGASFAIEDDAALLTEARKKAFADARGKAELYAGAAGRPLGRVVRISETDPGFAGAGGMAAADARFPIEPGRQRLSASVTVEWALGS